MESGKYELGGIFKAIKSAEDLDTSESNDNEEESYLGDLFSYKVQPTEKEDEISEEQIEKYLNPKEVEGPKKKAKKEDDLKKESEKEQKFEEESPERKARTIYVGNVALTVSKKKLKKLFSKFGEIESLRIRSVPRADPKISKKVAYIKKEFHSERENMNAYIVYKDKECAQKALQCNGVVLEDMHLRVDLSENKKHDTNATVFVGNIPFKASEEKLRNHFSQCGEVDDVRIIRDKATGIGKGFAYVRFKDKGCVMFGLKLNSSEFEGRNIRVFKAKDPNNMAAKGKHGNKNFQGLRSTSRKDVEMGKKLFGNHKKTKQNAMQRIRNKKSKTVTKGSKKDKSKIEKKKKKK